MTWLLGVLCACTYSAPQSSCDYDATSTGRCSGVLEHGHFASMLFKCNAVCDPGYTTCGAGDCATSYLDDPKNCGGCGSACDGACVQGHCGSPDLVGWADGWAVDVAADARGVAWLTSADLHVRDAAGTRLVMSGEVGASAIALDADWVYWTTPYAVRRALRGGGAVETIATSVAPHGPFLAADGVAYFSDGNHGVVDTHGKSWSALRTDAVFGWTRWVKMHDRAVLVFNEGPSTQVVDTFTGARSDHAINGVLVGANADELLVFSGPPTSWISAVPLDGRTPSYYWLDDGFAPSSAVATKDRIWAPGRVTRDDSLIGASAMAAIDRAGSRVSFMSVVSKLTQPALDGPWVYWLATPGLGRTRLERLPR